MKIWISFPKTFLSCCFLVLRAPGLLFLCRSFADILWACSSLVSYPWRSFHKKSSLREGIPMVGGRLHAHTSILLPKLFTSGKPCNLHQSCQRWCQKHELWQRACIWNPLEGWFKFCVCHETIWQALFVNTSSFFSYRDGKRESSRSQVVP